MPISTATVDSVPSPYSFGQTVRSRLIGRDLMESIGMQRPESIAYLAQEQKQSVEPKPVAKSHSKETRLPDARRSVLACRDHV